MSETIIAKQIDILKISERTASLFIGIGSEGMWDLAAFKDDAWDTLTLLQLCRLLILLKIDIHETLPSWYRAGLTKLDCSTDEYGVYQVAASLRTMLGDKVLNEAKIGWATESLTNWLSNDELFAEIPPRAIWDICNELDVDACSVINQYLAKLGRKTPASHC